MQLLMLRLDYMATPR